MKKLNKIYIKILKDIWNNGIEVNPRGMKTKELLSYSFILKNPKNRIITIENFETNTNYAEIEYQWYLSGKNTIDFHPLLKKIWNKYSDDGITVNSAYGYQIFGNDKKVNINQWEWIKEELRKDSNSRRCIININLPHFKNHDSKDIPCTCYFQILVRNNKLHWITTMRSQDIFLGFRNDIYCFTRLQEKLSEELNISLGNYYHFVGSIHLYENQFEKVKQLLRKNE